MVRGLLVCSENLTVGGGNHLFPRAGGGLVPHPPAVLFPENLYHMCTCDGGSEGAVNRCKWGLAEGIVYDNPQNLERNMNK